MYQIKGVKKTSLTKQSASKLGGFLEHILVQVGKGKFCVDVISLLNINFTM